MHGCQQSNTRLCHPYEPQKCTYFNVTLLHFRSKDQSVAQVPRLHTNYRLGYIWVAIIQALMPKLIRGSINTLVIPMHDSELDMKIADEKCFLSLLFYKLNNIGP